MTDIELGWFTGIIDGEGTIYLKKNGKNSHQVVIKVPSTDIDIVERCLKIAGVGKIYQIKSKQAEQNPHWKQAWFWQSARREELLPLLELIEPHLSERKRESAIKAIEDLKYSFSHLVNCKGCGIEFTASDWRTKYCNVKCRQNKSAREYRQKKKEAKQIDRT